MDNPFTPPKGDSALQMLADIFGPAFAHAAGLTTNAQGANALSEAYRFFNSGVLLFGVLIMVYVTVMGVTHTANDGEALGKNWSTMWTPIRTLSAGSGMIPTASGYSAVQVFGFIVVVASIGFASNLWKTAVGSVLVEDVASEAVKSVIDDRNFEVIASNALRMQVCAYAVEKAINASLASGQISMQLRRSDSTRDVMGGVEYQTELFYQSENWGKSKDLCGRLRFISRFNAPDSHSAAVNQTGRVLQEALNNARYSGTVALFGEQGVKPIADSIIAAVEGRTQYVNHEDIQKALAQLRVSLTANLRATVQQQVANVQSNLIDQYTDKGWIWAGSLYTDLNRIKDAVNKGSRSDNDFIPGENTLVTASSGDMLAAQDAIFQSYMVTTGIAISKAHQAGQGSSTTPSMPTFDSGFTMADFADGGGAIKGATTRFFKSWGDSIVGGVVHHLSDKDNKSVILQLKDMGDYIAGSAEAGKVAAAVTIGALEGMKTTATSAASQPIVGAPVGPVAGAIAGIQALFRELLAMITPSATVILYIGYFLGIWLPAVPFMVSAVAIAGWVIAVTESIAAMQLWAAAHVTPATDNSFIGSQAQGYLLLLSLFFRPSLIVMGLIVSDAVLNPIVHWINEAFLLYFRVAQADSLTGLLSVAGFLLLYASVIFAVTMLVFGLPQTFPDRILKWIGTGIGDLGEGSASQRIENSASSQAQGAALAAATNSGNFREQENQRREEQRAAGGGGSGGGGEDRQHQPEGISGQSNSFKGGE